MEFLLLRWIAAVVIVISATWLLFPLVFHWAAKITGPFVVDYGWDVKSPMLGVVVLVSGVFSIGIGVVLACWFLRRVWRSPEHKR